MIAVAMFHYTRKRLENEAKAALQELDSLYKLDDAPGMLRLKRVAWEKVHKANSRLRHFEITGNLPEGY